MTEMAVLNYARQYHSREPCNEGMEQRFKDSGPSRLLLD